MKSKTVKLLTALVGLTMLGSLLSGCKGKETAGGNPNALPKGDVTYPIKTDVKLTYWTPLDSKVSVHSKTLSDSEFGKKLVEMTGIKVEFQHPPQGQEKETFNIMVASKELPDIVERNWANDYSGGPEKAIGDGTILKLNTLLDSYAPNYKKLLASDKELEKQVKTDTGNLFGFPFVRGHDLNTVYFGPVFRGDWLRELNLSIPETIDEFEAVLRAFKDKKGIAAPYTQDKNINGDFLTGAFGFSRWHYIDDAKKVAYGPMHPKFKDYLTVLNRWYKDKLLDNNFASNDGNAVRANILNGKSGSTLALAGGGIGTWMNSMVGKDDKFDIVAAPYPVVKKGDKVKFAQKDWKFAGMSAAVTTSCKNPEMAVRLLDFGYTQQGNMLYNFGTEGVSYKMVGDYPTYLDVVFKNPNKLSIAEAIALYSRASYSGPMVQRKEYIEQFLQLKQQKDALALWAKADPYPNKYPNTTTTPEESTELSAIESDINTYVEEMIMKFIMGTEPLSNVEKFQQTIKGMKFDKALQIRQQSVDRYNKR